MGHKILHKKQKYKQWATKYYTENKNINNGPQNTTLLWSLVCSGVGVAQSYVFCVVFCDPLFVVGFVLLNLMFSV
jgi:hypothetical protein